MKLRTQSLACPPAEAGSAPDRAQGSSSPDTSQRIREIRGPRFIVGIPSVGRPGILPDTVRAIAKQDRLPDVLILSVASLEDLGDLAPEHLPFAVEIVIGQKGATKQRNRMIELLLPNDILLLLDDDFLMAPDYLRRTQELFDANKNVVLATGTVLADGIRGPGYSHTEGKRHLSDLSAEPMDNTGMTETYSGYGCNMAFRAATVLHNDIRFDEALPLYSWLEDVDFSRRLAPYGSLVKSNAMRGVHLGTKTGRTPGVFLGYSQIANPAYLRRKGTISGKHAFKMALRNTASNMLRSFVPPPWADYRGRLKGNILAALDLIRGKDSPDRILEIKP